MRLLKVCSVQYKYFKARDDMAAGNNNGAPQGVYGAPQGQGYGTVGGNRY